MKACKPVIARPRIKAWISCVPENDNNAGNNYNNCNLSNWFESNIRRFIKYEDKNGENKINEMQS